MTACQPVIDKSAGYRHLVRYLRQFVSAEKTGFRKFRIVKSYLPSRIFSCEAYHNTTWIRPRLIAEISHIANINANLFTHLTACTVFESLASFKEACDEPEHVSTAEISGMDKKDFIVIGKRRIGPASDAHYGSTCEMGEMLCATIRTLLSHIHVTGQTCATY